MSADLAKNWWLVVLRGVLGILFGLLAFLLPGPTLLSLVLIFSAYMLVDGIFALGAAIRAARRRRRWGLLALEGVLALVTGVVAFLWPVATVVAFVLVMAGWAVVSGGLMIVAAFQLAKAPGRWWLGVSGLASVLYGILLMAWPPVGALVMLWWFGAYAIVFGTALVVLGIRLRSQGAATPSPTTGTATAA
ncbi:MAG: HdeD family acid-resistance protein [Microvirga sp.]